MSLAWIATAALLSGSPAAPAEATARTVEASAPTTWYGYEPLLCDAGAVAVVYVADVVSFLGHAPVVAPVGTVAGSSLYVLGGPAAHWRHGRTSVAWLDLGMRLGLPAVGYFTGATFFPDTLSGGTIHGAYGFLMGVGASMVIDALFLSSAPVNPKPPASDGPSMTPYVGVMRGSPLAGVSGSF